MNLKKLSYVFFVSILVLLTSCGNVSNDATLKISSTVKGVTLGATGLGTPAGDLLDIIPESGTYGAVTLTVTQAASTTNIPPYVTLFEPTNSGATVKVVKPTSSDENIYKNFETDLPYANQDLADGELLIIKVTAADTTTVLYYIVQVTVAP